jgi:hypothetical protein
MATEKTKKLLDSLKDITKKPVNDKPITIPDTNKMWTSTCSEDGLYDLPLDSKKATKHTVVDEDGNEDSWFYIDRMYGGNYGERLVQADGTEYQGKLYTKRRLIKGVNGNNFYSKCTTTADGRWFDNSGMPINPPKEIEKDAAEEETEDEKENNS